VPTLLFLAAGQSQCAAIRRTVELGARVVAVDGNGSALGFSEASVVETISFQDVEAVIEVGRRRRVNGVLTVASDRAVPVVAAVAEALGLPGIGVEVAGRMTNKLAMRNALAEAGVAQPLFAGARTVPDLLDALEHTGLPAVVKPVDSGGQRGLSLLRTPLALEDELSAALAFSRSGQAIVEQFVDGHELNAILVVRGGEPELITLSDRIRPPGPGWGVGWIHLYPSSLSGQLLETAASVATAAVRALGLRDGIAFPQLLARPDGEVLVTEIAARIPAGQMADLVRYGTGVDLVEIAYLQALGKSVPDSLVRPRCQQPLAIRFLTAQPGPLPAGRVVSVSGFDDVLAAPGVVQAELYFQPGETIHPVRVDEDRRGYVLATATTPSKALRLAEEATRLLDVRVV
jgi:biotin carboxylase